MDGDERTDGPEKPPVEASTSDGAPPQDGRPTAGRPEQLTDAQMRELAEIVETNPEPSIDGVVPWWRVDLKRVTEDPPAPRCL